MGDLTSLLRQLAAVEERAKIGARPTENCEVKTTSETQLCEEMDGRHAAVVEVASGVTCERVRAATSAAEVWGVSSSRSLLGLGAAIGLPRVGANSSVDSRKAEVVPRDFGSSKQSVPKFSEKSKYFPL